MSSQAVRLLACSLTLCLLVAGAVRAQESKDSALKDEAQRKALEAQKVEKEVKESLENAALIAKSDPAEAAKLLKLVRDQVTDDTSLSPEKRKSLLGMIDARIKSAGERPSNPLPGERPSNTRPRDDGTHAQDKERFDTVVKVIEARKGSLADARELRERQGEANTKVDRDIVKSSIPAVSDVEFPRDWLERTKKRSEVKMTEKELKLMKALNTPLRDIDFDKRNFKDVLEYLQEKTGLNIIVPKSAMEEVGITYETPVSLKVDNITLRSVLKKILGDLNLTYIVKDGEINVMTPERARQTYSTRAYYVGDLAFVTDFRLGPIVQRAAMAQSILLIMNTIVQTVEPNSWQANNAEGGGTITFDPITMSILVKQSAEVHLMLGVSMRR
jgi:hypothetical protein